MADPERTDLHRPPQPPAGAGAGRRLVLLLERHRWARAALIGLVAAAAALLAGRTWLVKHLEVISHDARVRAAAGRTPSELIEVVDYDQFSIERLCAERRLPRFGLWPRTIHKRLVEYLERGRPKVIVFDILFASAGDPTMLDDEDRDFAEYCGRQDNIVQACSFFKSELDAARAGRAYPPPARELAERLALGPGSGGGGTSGATWPYPALLAASRAVGSVQLETDPDSVTRRVSPAAEHGGWLWPTLSTATAAAGLNEKPAIRGAGLALGREVFPLEGGRRLLRWYGPGIGHRPGDVPRYRTWPAHLLFDSETVLRSGGKPPEDPRLFVDPARFQDKIVLVASNAPGSYDLRYTPFGYEPGVYVHAAAVESLLRGDRVERAGWRWTALAAAGLGLAAAGAFAAGGARRSALFGSGAALLLAGAYLGAAFLLYARRGLWVELVVPMAALALALAGSLLAGYLVEGRQARRLRKGFARFLSPEVLAEVSGDLDNLRPGMGRRREVTIMFCDARGFTPLAERLSPEAAVELLDAYLGAMSECILEHGGTLSKYIGDGIMAFWGAPVECPDHAARAARAALAMRRAQQGLKERRRAAGQPCFDIGIGLHAGEAVVGTVGSEQRLDYTAIGDTVNLASRVEGLTKEFGVRICVTGDLAGRAGAKFEYRALGRVNVKGRTAGVEIFELVGVRPEPRQEGGT